MSNITKCSDALENLRFSDRSTSTTNNGIVGKERSEGISDHHSIEQNSTEFTPSRIENARGNVTLPLESPTNVGDLNRQRCNENSTICISMMDDRIKREFIFKKLCLLNIGYIHNLTEVPYKPGYKRVFIRLRWNTEPKTVGIRKQLRAGQTIKFVYDLPWFWVITEINSPVIRTEKFTSFRFGSQTNVCEDV